MGLHYQIAWIVSVIHVAVEFYSDLLMLKTTEKSWYEVVPGAASSRDTLTKTNPWFNFRHLYVCGAIRASRGSSVIPLIGKQNRFNPNITNRSMTFDIYGTVIRTEI